MTTRERTATKPKSNGAPRSAAAGDAAVASIGTGVLSKKKTPGQTAVDLVESHRKQDPTIVAYWSQDDHGIQLIEVSREVGDTGEVIGFHYAANPDFALEYDLRIVIVHPNEWEKIQAGDLKLPKGWKSRDAFQPVK